jgi:hypothetical protein
MVRERKAVNSLKLVRAKAAEQLRERYIFNLLGGCEALAKFPLYCNSLLSCLYYPNLVCFVLVRATVTANAVERMRIKCEQKTAAVVSEATLSLSHDLKKLDRLWVCPTDATTEGRGKSSPPRR